MNAFFGISSSRTLATVNRNYDNRMQVTGETDMVGSNTVYSYSIAPYNRSNPSASGYDAVGNIVSFSDSVMGTWDDTYDTLNRIASATAIAGSYSSAALSWTIDPFGNRTAQAVSGHPTPPMPQSWSATISSTHDNRIVYSSPPGANWTYDAPDGFQHWLNNLSLPAPPRVVPPPPPIYQVTVRILVGAAAPENQDMFGNCSIRNSCN